LYIAKAAFVFLRAHFKTVLKNRIAKGWSGNRALIMLALAVVQVVAETPRVVTAQTSVTTTVSSERAVGTGDDSQAQSGNSSLARYVDMTAGMTADEAVRHALAHNGELLAARVETEAARGNLRQARLRPNPTFDASRSEQIGGGDNTTMVSASLPLELGGRRQARIRVAERELEMRERLVADRERLLAAEVRARYGAAFAETLKLNFVEELLSTTSRGYRLVAARVIEGRTAPLEQNMTLVEVNRVRSMRESFEGRVRVAMLELRNLIGMEPERPLRLRGSFDDLIAPLPPIAEAIERALNERPDLQAARIGETLAAAMIEQARSTGRIDAELTAGYERMNSSFPVQGIDRAGRLRPVEDVFNTVTVGVSLDIPVRNRNQGAIEAAVAMAEAARRRREFAELTVRREVAAAYARYESAARAMEIFRVGVRGQADTNLDVVRQTYELGARTLLDYIAERRRFIETETEFINALLETYQARVEIERAIHSPQLITR
jgi:outer membrane protein, heavy metal efflux system